MDNDALFTLLSDALDLQRETMAMLRETVAVLKVALDEIKASRMTPITITPYTTPITYQSSTVPYTEFNWRGPVKSVCGDSLSNTFRADVSLGSGGDNMWQKFKDFLIKHLGWLKSVLSEHDGTGSASRLALFIMVLTVCGVLIYSVAVHHELPSRDTLLGLSSLASIGAGGYGMNRLSHKDDEKGPAQPDAPIVDTTGANRGDTK